MNPLLRQTRRIKMEKIQEQLIFNFRPIPMTRFQLDGAFYTLLSVKPMLNPQRFYRAVFISKDGYFIKATILGENRHPDIYVMLEVEVK